MNVIPHSVLEPAYSRWQQHITVLFIDLAKAFDKIQECASPYGFDLNIIYVVLYCSTQLSESFWAPNQSESWSLQTYLRVDIAHKSCSKSFMFVGDFNAGIGVWLYHKERMKEK